MSPSAKKFFVRSFCFDVMSRPSSERSLSVEIGISKTRELLERAVGQRVRRVAGLVQVLLGERVAVDDQRAAGRQVDDVGLERRRVHRDEDVGLVARRVDVVRAEADLEAGDAGQGARRSADLGREVGQRADVVAEDGGGAGELRAGQLHAVAGVAGEPDRDPIELLELGVVRAGLCGHSVVIRPLPCASAGGVVGVGSGAPRGTPRRGTSGCPGAGPRRGGGPRRRAAARSGSGRSA